MEKEKFVIDPHKERAANVSKLRGVIGQVSDFISDNSGILDTTLRQAVITKHIGLFAVECVVTTPDASLEGIGKVPVSDHSQVLSNTLILNAGDSTRYLLDKFKSVDIKPHLLVSLCDDDFAHSVDQPWSIANPEILARIKHQVSLLNSEVPNKLGLSEEEVRVFGWLGLEQSSSEISIVRAEIKERILRLLGSQGDKRSGMSLWDSVLKRFQAFVDWRLQLCSELGLPTDEKHVWGQALEELVSLVTQLHFLPKVTKNAFRQNMPCMYINTFPGFEVEDADCMRTASRLGVKDGKNVSMISVKPMTMNDLLAGKSVRTWQSKQSHVPMVCGDLTKWRKNRK